jgi:hypothetical protein
MRIVLAAFWNALLSLRRSQASASNQPRESWNLNTKRDAAEILRDTLALPTEARATLAGWLLETLDPEVDEEAEAAWAAEVTRRVLEAG